MYGWAADTVRLSLDEQVTHHKTTGLTDDVVVIDQGNRQVPPPSQALNLRCLVYAPHGGVLAWAT